MPITVEEKFKSRKQSGSEVTRTYIVMGTDDDEQARVAMINDVPVVVPVAMYGYTAEFIIQYPDAVVEEVDNSVWVGTCSWKPIQFGQQPAGDFQISFDISGQTQKINYSRQTVSSYVKAGETLKQFNGAINVSSDGTVEGTDITVPFLSYQIKKVLAPTDVTEAWVNSVAMIVGTVNSTSFGGYAAGQLLLTKVSGQQCADTNWDITYNFAVSKNVTGLVIAASGIPAITKNGWDYLWVYYETRASGTVTNKIPISAYVERVYEYADYNTLTIDAHF